MKTQYNALPLIQRQKYSIYPVDRKRYRTVFNGDQYECGICFKYKTYRFDELYDHVRTCS